MNAAANRLRIGVMGASGYVGADLVRLLAGHPQAEIALLTANAHAGKPLAAVFPHLGGLDLPDLIRVEDADWADLDVAFCALPHGTTQEIIAGLPERLEDPNDAKKAFITGAWSEPSDPADVQPDVHFFVASMPTFDPRCGNSEA